MLLVTQVWPFQTWYLNLLQMSIEQPLTLAYDHRLSVDQYQEPHPLVITKSLKIAVWIVTATICLEQNGLGGAVYEILIHFSGI